MAFKLMELYAQVSERGVAATGRAIDGLHVKASRVDRAMDAMASKVKWAFAIAIPAAIVYSIKAFAVQEKATNSLRAALDAQGDSVEAMLPRLERQAAAIQQLTVYGDEFVMGLMVQARNLGTTADKLDDLTRKAIGLAKALGMDVNTAIRYVVLAQQGEYTMLQRYIPALRTATTATEKLAVVNDAANRGWRQAQEEIETTSGKLRQLKNAAGDAAEGIGSASGGIIKLGAEGLKDWIDGATEAIALIKSWGVVGIAPIAKALGLPSPAGGPDRRPQSTVSPAGHEPFAEFWDAVGRVFSIGDQLFDVREFEAEVADLVDELLALQAAEPSLELEVLVEEALEATDALWALRQAAKEMDDDLHLAGALEVWDAFEGADRITEELRNVARGAQGNLLDALGRGDEAERLRIDAWLDGVVDRIYDLNLGIKDTGLLLDKANAAAEAAKAAVRKPEADITARIRTEWVSGSSMISQIQSAIGDAAARKAERDKAEAQRNEQIIQLRRANGYLRNLGLPVTN